MVSSMQTAHYYRQRLDGGELYFLALDPLKNGGWRGLLVRHYARPEKAVKTTVPKSFFNLWEHVTSVPPAVDKRFGDAGNLGTMRNRRKRGTQRRNAPIEFYFKDGRGKTYGYSKAALEDTVFESELWDRPSVRARVKALRPGKSITIGKERLTRADIERNGLREFGRKIAKGAKRAVARVDEAMQRSLDGGDDGYVAKVREHSLDAAAQYNAYNMGAARAALSSAHRTLDKIKDADKRENAAKALVKLERLLGVYRNRSKRNRSAGGGGHTGGMGISSRNGKRRNAGVHDDKFWGGSR